MFYFMIFLCYQIKMHYINSDISTPVNLQQNTDNRDRLKRVRLKTFTYFWGRHDIHNETLQRQGESLVRTQPGYYSFQQLADLFGDYKTSMSVNESKQRVTLSTPSELKVSKRIKSMLGF